MATLLGSIWTCNFRSHNVEARDKLTLLSPISSAAKLRAVTNIMENPDPSKTTAGYVITLLDWVMKWNHTQAPITNKADRVSKFWEERKLINTQVKLPSPYLEDCPFVNKNSTKQRYTSPFIG